MPIVMDFGTKFINSNEWNLYNGSPIYLMLYTTGCRLLSER